MYNQHWKLSKNIKQIFDESDVYKNKRCDDIVRKFLKVTGDNKANIMILLDCLCRYDYDDKELLADVCQKLQKKITEKE